jgi:3-hydroxybutyrate dehydrogenase
MSDASSDSDEPELRGEDLLVVDDPHFTGETVALVTGAASGIGRATAVALAANGLTTVATDVDEGGLGGTADLALDVGAPGDVVVATADLTDDEDVERVVSLAADRGALRYVANVAGIQHVAPLEAFPMERYDLLTDVMLRAPFLVAKLAIPHIRATDDGVGAIGNMSSVHGHYATRDKPAYVTAKHGLHGLTKAIAAEGGGTIRGFSVSVGYVETPLMLNQIADTARERGLSEREVVEGVMLGQARTKALMAPSEVANLFVFGFSRHGRFLDGGDLLWDGGYVTTYE